MNASDMGTTLAAIEALGRSGRVSRTHVHKFLYLAEGWALVPSRHSFTLYRHGPYSFDLDGELQALRSVGAVEVEPDPSGYGARYSVARASSAVGVVTPEPFQKLADWLGPLTVKDLEAIATAEYFLRISPSGLEESIVDQVVSVKPHLSREHVLRHLKELKIRRSELIVQS